MLRLVPLALLACLLMSEGRQTLADDAVAKTTASPQKILEQFRKSWDDSQWTKQRQFGVYYMRADADDGWQARMKALQSLVAHGEVAVPALMTGLKSESIPVRILSAQALGYLPAQQAVEPLLEAAKSDTVAAVRLYAIDSLGMQGKTKTDIPWDELLRGERNRDARKHIGYAKERRQQAVDPTIAKALLNWDSQQMNSAGVGKLAPDFRLQSATGETIQLSDFRGKQSVVLVFIYGDT